MTKKYFQKQLIYNYIIAILALSFYLFFAFYDGVIICADSSSYITNSITREFLYPALLSFFRIILKDDYLFGIIVLQSLLAAYGTYKITICVKKHFSLGNALSTFIFCIPLFTSVLNRFFANRGSMYSNCILTEGMTISLFLLFFSHLLDYIIDHSTSSFWKIIILSSFMFAMRKQMIITLALFAIAYIFVNSAFKNNNIKQTIKYFIKNTLFSGIICLALLLSVSTIEHTYNYFTRGNFTGHSSDSRFILTMIFYVSEPEYAQKLPSDIQKLYSDIYDTCDANGYLIKDAPNGWIQEVNHFENNYDLIQIDTMWPAIREYVSSKHNPDSTTHELYTDEIVNTMISCLLPATLPRIMHVTFNNFISGMITSIAQRNTILTWYSLICYVGYLLLFLIWIKRMGLDNNTTKLCSFTLLSILINVTLVSCVIFCQTRYTIYNMALFYISGLILLHSFYKEIIYPRIHQ